jgi:hypothetical protein
VIGIIKYCVLGTFARNFAGSLNLGFAALAAASLMSCEQPQVPTQPTSLTGYGELTFGMSFTVALAKLGHARFNPSGVNDCFNDMPLKGCFLSPESDTSFYQMKAGIPYALGLQFSKMDKLSHIRLSYKREGNISRSQCLEVYARTLDWVRAEYGDLSEKPSQPGDAIERKYTPVGQPFSIGKGDRDGFFVATAQRDFDQQRNVWPFATFIVVDGKPICDVSVTFEDEALADPINIRSP